ncbi:transcription factor SPT20 homolog [Toxorhynchites rutilus septentrionalis]|uniref:transcription factor SPT20 homolog n=1 Tax=Toxorhynchites rutilus septentrionalis TaxID=329112 RepID=UPI0024788A3B|nr:transcription factor SPT20 homolog [Toxorhynchites rutilus septentrionalis]
MQWIVHKKMKLLCLFALLLALAAASSNDANDSNGTTNDDADLNRIRVDPTLRKALLRALRNLKDRQDVSNNSTQDGSNTTEENFATTILDEILEESTNSERQENVKFNTYTVDTENVKEDNEIIRTIVISKPEPTLPPVNDEELSAAVSLPDPVKDQDNGVDSNQVARSVSSGSANKLEDTKYDKDFFEATFVNTVSSTATTAQEPSTTTTTTSTTTTTEAPTHNEDGENIEKVKSEDVKIYKAPLVAAFTVQQDQQGVPRNVIPLFQTAPKKKPAEFNPPAPIVSPTVPNIPLQPVSSHLITPSVVPPTISFGSQTLEEKTRLLEQQLISLQTQQRIQEQLLRSKIIQEQQIILQQQRQLQQQRFRLEEEARLRLQKFEEEQRLFRQQQQHLQQQQQQLKNHQQQQQQFNPFSFQQQTANQQHQQNRIIPEPSQQQFIQELPRNTPSIPFISNIPPPNKSFPISVEQQLPFKEPVNFQSNTAQGTLIEQVKSISPPVQQFSPPQLSKQQLLPLKSFQQFNANPTHSLLTSQSQLSLDQQLPSLQRNRVFRHESDTGNFGFNQQQRTNTPFRPSQPIPIPHFQNGGGFHPFGSDNQLQSLLSQSGFTARSAEDFNIITKVLALNHGIPQSSSQKMFSNLSPEQQQQLLFRKK